jgi:hypothetical protein
MPHHWPTVDVEDAFEPRCRRRHHDAVERRRVARLDGDDLGEREPPPELLAGGAGGELVAEGAFVEGAPEADSTRVPAG